MTHDEYVSQDGTSLSGLLRAGEVTALELIDVAIERLEIVNPLVNAVVYRMDDEARAAVVGSAPSGVFAGVPFVAKDLQSNFAGHPTALGRRLVANHVREADTELVRRLRATGPVDRFQAHS
jgi:amidase